MTRFTQFFALAGLLLSGTVYAQRELKDIPIPDPEEEQKVEIEKVDWASEQKLNNPLNESKTNQLDYL